ncbi:NDMA-dependent alcohol dehydrogenase [Amycolatopsis thermophila]|uniref:S-(Hydroxymethyl)glutathione dehydrogenase/alcohol dehydrogenase n=1 Tax=Amycolatopsis thermophila TaxID=206084 RepID=A0ABU0F5E6_9PSEU|nr:NDMA-dependent alcohol dehydrogenase [Amycolatopsis thermophila]MDQ0382781.1 S-(hydroxymethyl)glutathione dehydrogenase/alcohol dehydrogenase [Amycolatopsis thermophila]
MKVPAAVLWERNSPWKVEEIELGEPGPGEVLVQLKASGICHSDDHGVTGDIPMPLPQVGGHEGAGVVLEVGEGVSRVRPGDHVVLSAIPACGNCRWCISGRANLCDLGRRAVAPAADEQVPARRLGGQTLSALCQLGTFASHAVVSELQAVRIDDDVPLDVAALIGCGVTTGVLGAIRVADVLPGDVVVVQGVGGIGINAVQGARIAGASTIVAVDPVERKRNWALEFGATHVAADMEEATALVADLTRGVMADKAILCVGVAHGEHLGPLVGIISKGGRVVVTSITPVTETAMTFSLFDFAMSNKELRGHVYGAANPVADFPRIIEMYRRGQLRLDELITTRYPLSEVNAGFADMHGGRNLRGLLEL